MTSPYTLVERFEDMSPTGKLRLIKQEDGDIIVAVVEDQDARSLVRPSVEFCTCGHGGGQSRHTLAALRALFDAIVRDNAETPQRRTPLGLSPEQR